MKQGTASEISEDNTIVGGILNFIGLSLQLVTQECTINYFKLLCWLREHNS